MGVDHGGADVFVSQQLLHGADVVALLEEVSGEGVAKGVGGNPFGDPGRPGCLTDGLLDAAGVEVVAQEASAARIAAEFWGRKEVLPHPGLGGVRVFAGQSLGEGNAFPVGVCAVAPIEALHALDLVLQRGVQAFGEQGYPVFVAFAAPDEEVVVLEIQVLNAEA